MISLSGSLPRGVSMEIKSSKPTESWLKYGRSGDTRQGNGVLKDPKHGKLDRRGHLAYSKAKETPILSSES
jgi:hypothetical protein